MPSYEEFAAEADAMATASAALCCRAERGRPRASPQAWWRAQGAWKRSEVFAFGPYREFPLRLGPQIDFWPARTEQVEELIAGDAELSAEALSSLGASARGMPVVEYLLYAPDEGAPLES